VKREPLSTSLESLDELFGFDAICAFLTEDERPFAGALGYVDWRLCGALSRVVQEGFFSAAPSERLLIPTDGRVPPGQLFVVGLGRTGTLTPGGLEHELGKAARMLTLARVESVAMAFPTLPAPLKELEGELLDRAFGPGFEGRVGLFAP
jgi:Cytosol aminopeptidase family, N-terminal domain